MITFSTPATATALVSLETVKQEFGITDGSSDDLLNRYIAEASGSIAKICARGQNGSFGEATVVETLRPTILSSRPIWLTHWPVTSIVSVVEDGVTLDADEYEIEDQRKLWRLDGADTRTQWAALKIAVTYTGGYSLPGACPRDLAAQCLALVKLKRSAQGRDPLLKREVIPGVVEQEFWVGSPTDDGMPDDVAAALLNYTNFSFG